MVQGCRGQVRTLTTWYIFNMVIKPIMVQSPFVICLRIPGIVGMLFIMRGKGNVGRPASSGLIVPFRKNRKQPSDSPDLCRDRQTRRTLLPFRRNFRNWSDFYNSSVFVAKAYRTEEYVGFSWKKVPNRAKTFRFFVLDSRFIGD